MTNTLSIAVLSHERPDSLYWMLNSLRKIADIKKLEIFVCDNSTKKKENIKNLIVRFPEIKFYLDPGCNQSQNFLNAYNLSNSKYIAFFHDDDNFYTSRESIKNSLNLLEKNKINSLFYFNSISYSQSKPFFLHIPQRKILKPYSNGAFPFRNVIFPAWIYPRNNNLKEEIKTNFINSKCGKYSDILLVENLLEIYSYNYKKLEGFYMHVQHENSDSNSKDYKARLKLIIHTLNKNNPLYWPKLIFNFMFAVIQSFFKKFF